MLTKAFVLLTALSCVSAVVVKVDLHLACAISNLTFNASTEIFEKDTLGVLDDLISEKFTFTNATGPQTLKLKSFEVDDGFFNDDLEPFLEITHNSRKDHKDYVMSVYLPDCPEIDNRKFCSYKVDISLSEIVTSDGKLTHSIKERQLTPEKE